MASRREQLRALAKGAQERIQAAAASRLEAAAARVRGEPSGESAISRAIGATRKAAAEGLARVAGVLGPAQAPAAQSSQPAPPAQPSPAAPARPARPEDREAQAAQPKPPAEARPPAKGQPAAPEAAPAPIAPPAPPAGPPPQPPAATEGDQGIEQLLRQLSELTSAANAIKQHLDKIGYGDAAKAVLGEKEPAGARPKEPQPPKPPPEPEPPPPPKGPPPLADDSPLLQGSSFYVPLMNRIMAFDVLWSEWARAGIGNPRNEPAPGERDASGRPLGRPASDEINYIPKVVAEVPGRDGGVIVPDSAITDRKEFIRWADQWGITSKVSFRVDGMVRAEGPVARKNIYVAYEPGSDFDIDEESNS